MSAKAIFVTGSNGGVGQFICEFLLEQGERNLMCHYRNKSEKITHLLKKFDLDPLKHLVSGPLEEEDSVSEIQRHAEKNFGGVDRLVNVAGSSTNGMSWKLSKSDFVRVVNDSLLTSFVCSKVFIPEMRQAGFGRIINFSSIVGFTGMAGVSHYCAAKAGLIGMTKAMAQELASKQITVNAIALGYFEAGLIDAVPAELQSEIKKRIPAGRFGSKNDVGPMVKYLTSKDASFVTGQVLHLNGGQY